MNNPNPQQPYLDLIANLLQCKNREEAINLLNANPDLVNGNLVENLLAVAANIEEENAANWLQQIANSLIEDLTPSYQSFLDELLEIIRENDGNQEIVYPFLQQNLDKLNRFLNHALQTWGENTFSNLDLEAKKDFAPVIFDLGYLTEDFPFNKPACLEIAITSYQLVLTVYQRETNAEDWAITQTNLGNAYIYRIAGNRSSNLEKAIECYLEALKEWRQDNVPLDWAATQNNLGGAYSNRIAGNRRENLEKAIECLEEALKERRQDNVPLNWAMTQNNLGLAYRNRIAGNRRENLEKAIECLEEALKERRRDNVPLDWAATQNNLGNAYSERIAGNRRENLEKAIKCYQEALKEWRQDNVPLYLAMTQNNLGNAYSNRIAGNRRENLEKAIECYLEALKERRLDNVPLYWAMTQNGLGLAYSDRIAGDRSSNLEKAIECYKAALKERRQDNVPLYWAMTQNGLGLAYSDRIAGDRSSNLEKAIECYKAALKERRRDNVPLDWATTQTGLGAAYSKRIAGDRSSNLEKAIKCYKAALKERRRDNVPLDWATTQTGLGAAYSKRIAGNRSSNLEKAIKCYKAALTIRKPNKVPRDCLETVRNLGDLAQSLENWDLAIKTYQQGIEAVEQIQEWVTTSQEKQQALEDALDIYENMVAVCIQKKRLDLALITIERSTSRYLVELLMNAEVMPKGATPEQQQQIRDFQTRLGILKMVFTNPAISPDIPDNQNRGETRTTSPLTKGGLGGVNPNAQLTPPLTKGGLGGVNPNAQQQRLAEIQQLEAQLNQLLTEIGDKEYLAIRKIKPLTLKQIKSLLTPTNTIIEWFITSKGFYTFLVTPKKLKIIKFHSEALNKLKKWADEYLEGYNKAGWSSKIGEKLAQLGELLDIPQIMAKIPNNCQHLILIPHLFLHLIPIHALPYQPSSESGKPTPNPSWEGKKEVLQDYFPQGITYAPSCQLLQRIRERGKTTSIGAKVKKLLFQLLQRIRKREETVTENSTNFFAIQNPTRDLNYSDWEVENIAKHFNSKQILPHEQANKNNLTRKEMLEFLAKCQYGHFACHGSFNSNFPLDSALILAGSIIEKEESKSERSLLLRNNKKADPTKCLTLKEIFTSLNLPLAKLIILSACETNVAKVDQIIDEYISLSVGFIYAGANNILGSLWRVDDLATASLMIRFYQNLLDSQTNLTINQALIQAQNWLRTITKQQFLDWLDTIGMNSQVKDDLEIRLDWDEDEDKPFSQPQYWASFTAVVQKY